MNKRLYIKNWIQVLLIIINVIAILIMGSDCEDLNLFITSHLLAGLVFGINSLILLKYGRLNYDD